MTKKKLAVIDPSAPVEAEHGLVFHVDGARLDRTGGDIGVAVYADILDRATFRNTFEHDGVLYVGSSSSGRDGLDLEVQAEPLVPVEEWSGDVLTRDQLLERWDANESTRGDMTGFGLRVFFGRGSRQYVVADASARFCSAQEQKAPAPLPAETRAADPPAQAKTIARIELAPEDLVESPLNPRRFFDPGKITELADSMREVAFFGELLARPACVLGAERYELVCGHRRKRAAIEAGIKLVRVEVRELTDAQALAIMMRENMDRSDLHPLEEADGFRRMLGMRTPDGELAMTLEDVAGRVGRPVSFVRARLRLADLEEPGRAAFERGDIQLGHALLLAGLQPGDQAEALAMAVLQDYDGSRPTVAELRSEIDGTILLSLEGVVWKLDDAELAPEAGSCNACPKRSGAQPELFPQSRSGDRCLDRVCHAEKRQAYLAKKLAAAEKKHGQGEVIAVSTEWRYGSSREKPEKGAPLTSDKWREVEEGSCAHARPAMIVDGRNRSEAGKVVHACADPDCRKGGRPRGTSGQASDEEKARREKAKFEAELSRRAIAVALERVGDGSEWDMDPLRLIVRGFWRAAWQNVRSAVLKRRGWPDKQSDSHRTPPAKELEGMSPVGLIQLLVELTLVQDSLDHGGGRELSAFAKDVGVDMKAITAEIRAEKKAGKRHPKKVAEPTPAPPAPKGKKKRTPVRALTRRAAADDDAG